nr:MAG TPA: head closure knob [Caudoviricetes sp.]
MANNNERIYQISNNTVIYIQKSFETFDINKLRLDFDSNLLNHFYFTISYSFDYQNWSDEYRKENFPDLHQLFNLSRLDVYISINFHLIDRYDNDLKITKQLTVEKNNPLNHITSFGTFINLKYDNNDILVDDIDISVYDSSLQVSKYPKWNLYDNNVVSVKNWLNQCRAISEMYGFTVIWFHTSPKATNHTLVNHFLKDVVSIKRININLPNNEIPQDRSVYTEWDIQLEGEFVTNVVDSLFKQAFGETEIPLQKDFMFFPLMNKMYRVSSVQPKNGFMGKVGWWEVFFTKFEDDASIDYNFEELTNIPFLEDITENSFYDEDYQIDINEEQQTVTESYSNKAIDSTHYVDVKESEYFREFYDSRVDIVSVNPDTNAFPVSMYNFSKIENRTIALTYQIGKGVNKRTYFDKSFKFVSNFSILKKFAGELIDFDNWLTLKINRRNHLIIVDNINQDEKEIDTLEIKEQEFYQLVIEAKLLDSNNRLQYVIKLFQLKNSQKIQPLNLIYIVDYARINRYNVNNMKFYGGKYIMNDIYLYLDDEKLIQDNVNPIIKGKTNI